MRTILVATGLAALLGCAGIGAPFDASHIDAIDSGEHDQSQIRSWFGEPHQVSTPMAHEKIRAQKPECVERWHYAHAKGTAGGSTRSDILVVCFDPLGRVCEVTHSQTE